MPAVSLLVSSRLICIQTIDSRSVEVSISIAHYQETLAQGLLANPAGVIDRGG
jgi:hypothetical protein